MIMVSVMYPNQEGVAFDFVYWTATHLSLVAELVGPALKGVEAERGLSGPLAGSPAPYVAVAHLLFDSVAEFQSAFGPHAAALMADIPKFTNVSPTIQIGEVLD
ncbi:MAG: EthD family reductase [Bryobacterales bacterium]|nr:EthD family reductase [Bryobacterales bacterium]